MKFEKLRIIQAGNTANFGEWEDEVYPLNITDEAVQSVVALGNEKPIHCRRTHNGNDMLDGYLGKFTNFVYEDGVAYADFEMSAALEIAYPNEAAFIATMIEKEPEMLGVSVMGVDERVLNGSTLDVTRFAELYSCDIVGLPAATTSLFNNNNQKEKKMNKFFSAFASLLKKSSFATETVETVSGDEVTIEAQGEEMAIGDKVFDSEGNPHPDGEIRIKVDDAVLVLVIEGGVITEVKPSEDPQDDRGGGRATHRTDDVPDEFSTRLKALEESVSNLVAQFNRATPKPNQAGSGMPNKSKTQLSKEAVAEAAKRFYNR